MRKGKEKTYSQAEVGNNVTKLHSAPMGVACSARRLGNAMETAWIGARS
jgi:hypothetical protein